LQALSPFWDAGQLHISCSGDRMRLTTGQSSLDSLVICMRYEDRRAASLHDRYARRIGVLASRFARLGDAIVLIQDAVFVLRPSPRDRGLDDAFGKGMKIFALKADLDARSAKAPLGVEMIGHEGLLEHVTRYERTVS